MGQSETMAEFVDDGDEPEATLLQPATTGLLIIPADAAVVERAIACGQTVSRRAHGPERVLVVLEAGERQVGNRRVAHLSKPEVGKRGEELEGLLELRLLVSAEARRNHLAEWTGALLALVDKAIGDVEALEFRPPIDRALQPGGHDASLRPPAEGLSYRRGRKPACASLAAGQTGALPGHRVRLRRCCPRRNCPDRPGSGRTGFAPPRRRHLDRDRPRRSPSHR